MEKRNRNLPPPTSTNRIWRHSRNHIYKSKEYVAWQKECDALILLNRQYPKTRITGPFEIHIQLANNAKGDGDNRVKAVLDWLQSREIIRNDSDCRKGSWEWVPTVEAPHGCRVYLKALTES